MILVKKEFVELKNRQTELEKDVLDLKSKLESNVII